MGWCQRNRQQAKRLKLGDGTNATYEPGVLRSVTLDDQFTILLDLRCQLVKCLGRGFYDRFLIGRGNPSDG